MHAISFLLKRAHLCSRNKGQKLLYAVPGMTPARFDILCFAREGGIRKKIHELASTTQKRIREGLGLSASVISRMLKRLEELGWIKRERDCDDRRVNTVMLTTLGRRKAWEAMRINFRGGHLARHYEWVARQLRPTEHVLDSIDHLYDTLDVVALSFDDEAWFYYDTGSRKRPPFWSRLPLRPVVHEEDENEDEDDREDGYDTENLDEEENADENDDENEDEDDREDEDGVVVPLARYPSPYQKWIAPLIHDQEALMEDRRRRDYVRDEGGTGD